jgi:membrane protein insertase Oxa1/YidC/SpoIIIJ
MSSSPTNKSRSGLASPQMITRAMPLFLAFISLRLPSGLVLYWATSNVVRLSLQRLIYTMDPLPAATEPEDDEEEEVSAETGRGDRPHPVSKKKERRRRRKR